MKAIGLAAAAVALGGCNVAHMFEHGPQVQGSGKLKGEDRKVGNFTSIVSAGSANCEVTVGSGPAVRVSADDNILPLVKTYVEKDTLIIECKGSFSTQHPIRVTISVPNLEAFATRGAGDSEIKGVRGKAFSAEISGSGNIKGTGQADNLSLAIKGSGDMDFLNLKARDASASISGSGDIRLFATGNLSAAIRGSGNISYAGKPANVSKSISGSGDIDER